MELIDEATGFHKVYPTGVGALNRSGRSFTPVGDFATHEDPDSTWYWYPRRYEPSYFGGLPFIRLDARNGDGYHTYRLHGPITDPLRRGYVSHGCMRMAADDIVELFYMLRPHAGAPVRIQQATRYWPDGSVIDVTPDDADPVDVYRSEICADAATGHGEALSAGTYEDRMLCDGEARYTVAVGRGDHLAASIEATGPVTLRLEGPATSDGTEAEANDGVWTANADLRLPEEGEITVVITGDPSTYSLDLVHTPFGEAPPAAPGWIGDACEADTHCEDSACATTLPGGLCTIPCELYCPDRSGHAATYCVDLGFDDGGRCVSQCNDDADCRSGYACTAMPRNGDPSSEQRTCVPTR